VSLLVSSDDVFDVIRAAKAKRFNISSEFVDESLNDEEPHFYDQPPPPQYDNPPPKHEGYVVYQTAVHYDSPYNKPNNYNNRQQNYNNHYSSYGPPDTSAQGYGYNQNNGYNSGYNYNNNNVNRAQYRPTYSKHSRPDQKGYPSPSYDSHYSPPPVRYGNDNHYPQQQQYDNEMISQSHQTRYKRQTGAEVVDPVCQSRMILVEPKAALNDRSQWKFVINLADRDPRLKQAIKVEVCQ
jgi:hypothetical protein